MEGRADDGWYDVKVKLSAAEPNAKRITATLRWQDRSGQPAAPVRISTWRYKLHD